MPFLSLSGRVLARLSQTEVSSYERPKVRGGTLLTWLIIVLAEMLALCCQVVC